jgi:hypothetical protein
MSEKSKFMPGLLAVALILIGLVLAGCSTGGIASTTQDTSSSPAQTATAPSQTTASPAQSGTAPASTATGSNTSGSTASPTQGSAPSGRQGGPDMSKQLSRAAQILGITEAQLTSAFQQAQESVFGKAPTGTPPSGTSSQQPPAPPSGTSGQQPPQDGQGPNTENMQKLYSKMAEILNISADKISSAMDQARQELQPTTTK